MKKVWNAFKTMLWLLFISFFFLVSFFGIMAGITIGLKEFFFFPEASVYITTMLFGLIWLSQVLKFLDQGNTFKDLWKEIVHPTPKDVDKMIHIDYVDYGL